MIVEPVRRNIAVSILAVALLHGSNPNALVDFLSERSHQYVPVGAAHRLENPGQLPLHVIEVRGGEAAPAYSKPASLAIMAA